VKRISFISCIAMIIAVAMFGCAHKSVYYAGVKAEGEKIIAIDASRQPWVMEVENRLRASGFKVLRYESDKIVTTQTQQNQVETTLSSTARYVVKLSWEVLTDRMHRCFGGGYWFDYYTAEVVDVKTNETVLSVSRTGYSENCPPLSSTMYSDIANAIGALWNQ